MATIEEEIEGFAKFAKTRLEQADEKDLTIDDLFDEWRVLNPPASDALAIKASLRDMEAGETGQSFEQFADEFRSRNSIADDDH